MRKAILGALIAALAFFGSAAMAAATSITVTGYSGRATVTLHAPGQMADGVTTYAEAFTVTGDLGSFDAYCVDLNDYIYVPGGPYELTTAPMTTWSAPRGPDTLTGTGGYAAWLYNTYATLPTTNKAALQVAIWEVLYETAVPMDPVSGNPMWDAASGAGFWITGNTAVASQANIYLASVGTNIAEARWLQLNDTSTNPNFTQDLIGPVPEPGTLLLLGSGLSAFALIRRRRL